MCLLQDCNHVDSRNEIEQTVPGIFVIRKEGADADEGHEDVGVVIKGVEVLCGLGSVTNACAMLFGLIYALDLSFPENLKYTFEVFQKIIMNLDGQKLSSPVQKLSINMFQ